MFNRILVWYRCQDRLIFFWKCKYDTKKWKQFTKPWIKVRKFESHNYFHKSYRLKFLRIAAVRKKRYYLYMTQVWIQSCCLKQENMAEWENFVRSSLHHDGGGASMTVTINLTFITYFCKIFLKRKPKKMQLR